MKSLIVNHLFDSLNKKWMPTGGQIFGSARRVCRGAGSAGAG